MNKIKKLSILAVLSALAVAGGAFAGCAPKEPDPNSSEGADVAGTYTITYTTQQISGNVRHSGYVTAMGGQEKNTIVLKKDGTYEYTKLLTNDTTLIPAATAETAASVFALNVQAEAADEDVLFSWRPANDGENPGTCELDFNKDGTFRFSFPSYGIVEVGTWTWKSWNMTLTYSDGESVEIPMDATSHEFKFTYIARKSSMLTQTFACASSVWGVALGTSGSYTPEADEQPDEKLSVSHYYTGTATRQTSSGADYQATLHMFLLSDGTVYAEVQSDASSQKSVGEWTEEGGTITVTVEDAVATVADGKIKWDDIEAVASSDIPSDFADVDWEKLIEDAQAPAASGPFVLTYVFEGTYTVEGTTVTLNSAQSCTWSEDWGRLVDLGFTSVSGTEEDELVYSKGPTGYKFLVMDHFSSPFLFAPTIKDDNIPDVTYNYAVKIVVDKDTGSFTYSTESNFD